MGRIGMPELLIILVIVLLVFGANRLPQLGRGIGSADSMAGRVGRGLDNMKTRAAQLGGPLQVDSTAAGTLVTLRVPTTVQPG